MTSAATAEGSASELAVRPRARRSVDGSLLIGRLLLVAFGLVVIAFVASSLLTASRLEAVTSSSQMIAGHAMPRVIALSTLRERIRELEGAIERTVEDGGQRDLDSARIALTSAEASAGSCAALGPPKSAGKLWARASADVESALRESEAVLASAASGDHASAQEKFADRVMPSASRADSAIWQLVDASAAESERQAMDIETIRARSTALSFALDGLATALSVALAIVAFLAIRRYARIVEARSEELELFASRVAHDVRSPLSPVLFALERAKQLAKPDDPLARAIERGRRGVLRTSALVEDLFAFARSGGRPDLDARASLRKAVEATMDDVAPQARASAIELHVEAVADATVACAPGVLSSVLSNLIRNAVKYMGDATERRVTVRVTATGGLARVAVHDTGPGLPPGTEDFVFEPYARLDRSGQSGLGLGLATVKRLVEAHGGHVGVHSGASGATFWFELPLS